MGFNIFNSSFYFGNSFRQTNKKNHRKENQIHLLITSPKKIKLVWSDEFNYNGLPDSSKWNYEVRGNGCVNHGKEFYTKADTNSAIVKNGVLSIIARKEKHGNNDYTSARLLTTVGGDFAGKEGIDDAAFPVVYQIDYVHVYE